jgi:hypothetical protein
MSNVHLDLDALAPQVKKVKIGGKILDCYPPKVLQLVEIAQVWDKIQTGEVQSSEALPAIKKVLEPIIPAIKKDKTIDFTYPQLVALIKFAQSAAVETAPSDVKAADTTAEKKTPIAKQ